MPTVPGLQPLRDAALPLIASLLTLTIETSTAEFDPGAFDGEASAAVSFLPVSTVTVGQGLSEHVGTGESENGDDEEPNDPEEPNLPVTQESSSWQPFLMRLDEALDQFCRDSLDQFMSRDEPATDGASPLHVLNETSNLWQHARIPLEARAPVGRNANHLPLAYQEQMIDEAIRLLWSDESRSTQTSHTPTPAPLTPDRNVPVGTGPTVAAVSSTEIVNRQEGVLLSSLERGYELLTEFAVSLLTAAVVMSKSSDTQTSSTLPAILQQEGRE